MTLSFRKSVTPLTQQRRHDGRVEALEARIAPARMFAVDETNHLLSFDSATPGTLTLNTSITGLAAGEIVLGIDVRPATGELYALGITDNGATRTGKIYKLNTTTAAATLVGQFSAALADSSAWGFDFNPTADRIRVVERGSDLSLRVHPDTGALVATDTSISGTEIDAVAYDRNEGGTGLTTLYGINFANDHLVRIGGIDGDPSPNDGAVTHIGAMGFFTAGNLSFDIESVTGIARAAFLAGGARSLYTINLLTGDATLVGAIGNGTIPIAGLTTVMTTLAVVGTLGDDSLVVTATSANDGSYSLNGGPAVPFTNVTSFSFLGSSGDDTFTINNPAATLFAPADGIIFNGQAHGTTGDTLIVQGGGGAGTASTVTNAVAAGEGSIVTTKGMTIQAIDLVGAESIFDLTAGTSLAVSFGSIGYDLSVLPGGPADSAVIRESVDPLGGKLDVTFKNKNIVNFNPGEGGDTITYNVPGTVTGLATLNFNMAGGTDTVEFLGLASGLSANVQLQNGVPDRVVIGGTFAAFNTGTGNLLPIQGSINVDDSGGVGELYIDNSSDVLDRTLVQDPIADVPSFNLAGYSINPTHLNGFFRYTNAIQTFMYAGGSGGDLFSVNARNSADINQFFGNGGTDTLLLSDSANMGGGSYVINESDITRDGLLIMGINSIEALTFTTGPGNDVIDASESPIGVTIIAGLGDDTIIATPFLDTINGGEGGFDTYIALTEAVGDVLVTDDGISNNSLGNDVFTRNIGIPSIEKVVITGDAGANTLDADNFSGVAVLAGGGGKDVIIGADVKILGGTATFTDVDGDLVTLKVGKANLSADELDLVNDGMGLALRSLDLTDPKYKGVPVTLTSKRTATGGDGFINLGYLKANGNDLTAVKIDGDLGRVDAGDTDPAKPGIASLTVHSFGELGLNTQDPITASAVSNLKHLGALKVKTNVANITLSVDGKIGSVKIGGNLENAVIAARGQVAPLTAAAAVAIKSVTVGGTVRESSILAGYLGAGIFLNQNVQIGNVTVKGNWIASNLVAGTVATDGFFGNDNDARFGAADAIAAKIAKVVILGQAYGTFGGVDHYGIVAETIGSAIIGKAKLKFLATATENFAFGPTPDFRIREIA